VIEIRNQPWQDPISKNPSQKLGLVKWLKVKGLSSSLGTTKNKQTKLSAHATPPSNIFPSKFFR
jgi:hypothetical protein